MAEPVLTGSPLTNVYSEHQYAIRCTMGASTAMTYRSMAATAARPTTTTLTITLPKAYTEITRFEYGRFPTSVTSQVGWVISTNNIAVDGTVTLTAVAAGSTTAPTSGDVFYFTLAVSSDVLNDRFTG